jgi:hypothetical protein
MASIAQDVAPGSDAAAGVAAPPRPPATIVPLAGLLVHGVVVPLLPAFSVARYQPPDAP